MKEAAGKEEQEQDALAFIDNPSDLLPGVYEGGLKTWECSLDLVNCLASFGKETQELYGKRVIEVRLIPLSPCIIHSTVISR